MNTKQFINKYSGAALDAYEIAELAVDNLPADNEIRLAAEEYLHRKDQFFFLLETLGFEIG